MKRIRNEGHIVDFLFVLGLFFVFAFSALMLILIGSGVYKKTVDRMNENFNLRTTTAYITEKIRQGDIAGAVTVEDFDGNNALVLTQDYYGAEYSTYLYEYDGHLKELFTAKDNKLSADAGTDILPVRSFEATHMGGRLWKLTVVEEDGSVQEVLVSTRCDD